MLQLHTRSFKSCHFSSSVSVPVSFETRVETVLRFSAPVSRLCISAFLAQPHRWSLFSGAISQFGSALSPPCHVVVLSHHDRFCLELLLHTPAQPLKFRSFHVLSVSFVVVNPLLPDGRILCLLEALLNRSLLMHVRQHVPCSPLLGRVLGCRCHPMLLPALARSPFQSEDPSPCSRSGLRSPHRIRCGISLSSQRLMGVSPFLTSLHASYSPSYCPGFLFVPLASPLVWSMT